MSTSFFKKIFISSQVAEYVLFFLIREKTHETVYPFFSWFFDTPLQRVRER